MAGDEEEDSVADQALKWLRQSQGGEFDPSEAELTEAEIEKLSQDLRQKFQDATANFETNAYGYGLGTEERKGRKVFLKGDQLYSYFEDNDPDENRYGLIIHHKKVTQNEAKTLFEQARDPESLGKIDWDGNLVISEYMSLKTISYLGKHDFKMIEREGRRYPQALKNTPRVITIAEEILKDITPEE